jgi:[ribosomal protein S5]-alanine N-acetyltransferase
MSTTILPPTPTLETPRLVLRPLCPEDAPAIQRRFPRWDVVRWLAAVVPWPYPQDGAVAYIRRSLEQRARGERFLWAITVKGDAEAIGGIDLWPDDGSREQRGFWLDPEFHGRGLMTEAAERVTEYAFLDLGWAHLWLTNAADNAASRRIKEKQGAKLVAREPARFVAGDGIREIWLLSRDEWYARRAPGGL